MQGISRALNVCAYAVRTLAAIVKFQRKKKSPKNRMGIFFNSGFRGFRY